MLTHQERRHAVHSRVEDVEPKTGHRRGHRIGTGRRLGPTHDDGTVRKQDGSERDERTRTQQAQRRETATTKIHGHAPTVWEIDMEVLRVKRASWACAPSEVYPCSRPTLTRSLCPRAGPFFTPGCTGRGGSGSE